MIVLILEAVSLHCAEITLARAASGVFVGRVSAMVRERLWESVVKLVAAAA
jgi:hypothetical protein